MSREAHEHVEICGPDPIRRHAIHYAVNVDPRIRAFAVLCGNVIVRAVVSDERNVEFRRIERPHERQKRIADNVIAQVARQKTYARTPARLPQFWARDAGLTENTRDRFVQLADCRRVKVIAVERASQEIAAKIPIERFEVGRLPKFGERLFGVAHLHEPAREIVVRVGHFRVQFECAARGGNGFLVLAHFA